jgi:adenosine deaminase CECR1
MDTAQTVVEAHDSIIADKSLERRMPTILDKRSTRGQALGGFQSTEDYYKQRNEIERREKTLAFDFRLSATASVRECRADLVIQQLKILDKESVYDAAEPKIGFGGQRHRRFPGDHFLSNAPLITQTHLFAVAKRMPKGAHLHIHFNACLLPHVLLDIAKGMSRMFITSDLPLVPDNDYINFDRCEIQFSILPPERERPGNLFAPDYEPRQTMKFTHFLDQFHREYSRADVDSWLTNKLVFDEEEAHNWLQTVLG